jgi:cellulose 1,4-beta-cellobiosidase
MHRAAALLSVAAAVRAQQIGTNQAENHPALTWQKCTSAGCTTQNGQITLDANWRWTHTVGGFTNCYTGNTWDTSICSTDVDCASKCAIDGADYAGTYGITSVGNALTLKFKTGSNIGSRTYLMADANTYQGFTLANNEFTFDVDVSSLGCGLNGALYFVSMDLDGGKAKFPTNAAGAKYGTGYCDSQCPRDLKFINGQVLHTIHREPRACELTLH